MENKIIDIKENTSLFDVAKNIDVKPAYVIKKFMEHGMFVTINQRLDLDIINFIVREFGFTLLNPPKFDNFDPTSYRPKSDTI